MIELEQDCEEVRGIAVGTSTVVVLCVIGLSALIVYAFTRMARGHVRLDAENAHWWKRVPEDVGGMELRIFQEETEAERVAQSARKQLAAYGWTDRSAGLIHVPIEVAIDLYLSEQGGQ